MLKYRTADTGPQGAVSGLIVIYTTCVLPARYSCRADQYIKRYVIILLLLLRVRVNTFNVTAESNTRATRHPFVYGCFALASAAGFFFFFFLQSVGQGVDGNRTTGEQIKR